MRPSFSFPPADVAHPFLGPRGVFGRVSSAIRKLKMKKLDVSLRADEPLRAGLLRVADDLIDPGNRHDRKFASGLAFPKN